MYFMPRFDMVGYTPHISVAIYPFISSNETRCTPIRRSWLCSMPGMGFSSELFSSARIHSIFSAPDYLFVVVVVVCVPNLRALIWPSTVS